jgi:putative ubiquitin-RnfH superfamily antitoxin RatB of RatAB toxin-antitoxin module
MAEAGMVGRTEVGAVLRIQVCYAEPEHQFLRELQVSAGTTVHEAIVQSGVAAYLGEELVGNYKVGIYGKLKTLDTVLRERDRIEIYRPLKADPKEARRRRAKKKTAGA